MKFCSHAFLTAVAILVLGPCEGVSQDLWVTNDLVLWVKADAGVTADESGRVSEWTDQSGAGHDAFQANATQRPLLVSNSLGGQPVVRFGSSGNHFLNLTGQILTSQLMTIFAVVNSTSTDTTHREIFSNWANTNSFTSVFLGVTNLNPARARFTDDFFITGVGVIANPTDHFVFTGVSAASNIFIFQNRALIASTNVPLSTRDLTTPYVIGRQGSLNSEYWRGDIAEILVYNAELDADQQAEVWTYLESKYGQLIIATQPRSQTAVEGADVTLSVSAPSLPAPGYQWQFNGDDLPGETNASLALPNVQTNHAGDYRVVVTNVNGAVTSSIATLTVISVPLTNIAHVRSTVDPVNFLPTDTTNLYSVEGIVTTHTNITVPASALFYIQDSTAGIAVFVSGAATLRPSAGDRLRVTGHLGEFNGLLEFNLNASNPLHAVVILDTDNPLATPTPLDIADQTNAPFMDALEGTLIVISNVLMDVTSPTYAANTTLLVTNEAQVTFQLRLDARVSSFQGQPKPTAATAIIGVLGQFDPTDPRTEGYQILPTRFADVIPAAPPVIACGPDRLVECGTDWDFDVPQVSASCFNTNYTLVPLYTWTNPACGQTFTATRVWQATDACGQNVTCTQTVAVVDTTPPVPACPPNATYECGTPWDFDVPAFSDACDGNNVTILVLNDSTNLVCGKTFTITRTWLAYDSCSNTATCDQTVTVQDTMAPFVSGVSNRVIECGTAWQFTAPTAFDLCSGPSVTLTALTPVTNTLSGNTFQASQVWEVTDDCTNTAYFTQIVTVSDTTPPQIVCPGDIVVECAGPSGTPVEFAVSASDTCDPNVSIVAHPPSGTAFALGTNTVVCLATDDSGNTNQCTFEVVVLDTIPPEITCPPNLIVSEAPRDSGGAAVSFGAPIVADICDAAPQLYSSQASGSVFPTGTNTIIWTAVDSSGNSNSCAFTIRVIPYRLFVVTNVDDAGPGSLRQAMLDSNDAPDENLIIFNLPGEGLYTIHLLSPLPPITSPTTIDGWSQSGSNLPPVVELSSGSNEFDGLVIQAGPSVVRGLALHGFGTAIRIEGSGTNVIQGNYLGVDLTGTNAPGNAGDGIHLNSPRNLIGGSTAGTGNVISGNGGNGITLSSADANNNVIQGNLIGMATDGSTPLSNFGHGVFLTNLAMRNLIGGATGDAGNRIAFNGGAGVALDGTAGLRNAVLGNAIVNNAALGVDLGLDGITVNDATDADSGPNGLQNHPILSDARSAAGVTVIDGELTSTPNTTFRLEFFLNDTADPSTNGEGQVFIGAALVTVKGTGTEVFSASFPLTAVFTQFITATATDPQGNTSEFSPAVRVRTPPVFEAQPENTTATDGSPVTLCAETSGTPPIFYQWRLNGVNIPDATNACYTIPAAAVADGGTYTVIVQNALDAFSSDFAALRLTGTNILELPTGDHFADAVDISEYGFGTNGVVAGDNSMATLEPFEPMHAGKPGGRSVWYRWCTPEGSKGIATFRTRGSTFDTVMAVYQGSALSNLVEVASDEDQGGFYSSEIRFNAFYNIEPRTCYYIAIDGLGGGGGQFVLSWQEEKTSHMLPVILLPPLSQTVPLGASVTFSNYSVPECSRGHLDCNHDHWEPNYNQKEKLTYQWFFNGSPLPGETNASLVIPSVLPDHVGNYRVRVFTPWQYLDSKLASLQINNTGDESQAVQSFDKFLDALFFGNPLFIGTPPEPPLARGEVSAASTVVRGFTGTQIFNTTGSATEPGEVICGVTGGSSEWITFVAEQTGTLFLNTDGSTYDTVMAVFRRNPTNAAALQLLTCDNNSGADGMDSSLSVPVTGGQTNYVLVDGVNGATGILQLNYSLATTTILKILGQSETGANIVQVNGRPGLNFSLQGSTNLENWTSLVTTNAPDGLFNYTDEGSVPLPHRYYRALILP